MEDVHLPTRPILEIFLRYSDKVFNIIFFTEMILKWLAFGLKKYFTDGWCWVDFICVFVCSRFLFNYLERLYVYFISSMYIAVTCWIFFSLIEIEFLIF